MLKKVCLLSGGSCGDLIEGLSQAGFRLFWQISPGEKPAALEAAESLAPGGELEIFDRDLPAAGRYAAAFAACEDRFGRMDLYVKGREPAFQKPFLEMEEEEFHRQNNAGWRDTYFGVSEAGKSFERQGRGGCIVLLAGNRYRFTRAGESLTGSADAAMTKLVQYAGIEFARLGVRTVCLALSSQNEAGIPLGRTLTGRELAGWIAFLAGSGESEGGLPLGGGITGATIDLDGGECLIDDRMSSYGL